MNERTIHFADYLVGSPPDGDCSLAAVAAVKACRDLGATRLFISPGIYHFYPDTCAEQYICIPYNSAALRKIAFYLEDFADLEILGEQTVLMFHGRITPFILVGCRNCKVRGITIDYSERFFAEGQIRSATRSCLDLMIDNARFPYTIENGSLTFYGPNWQGGRIDNLLELDLAGAPAYRAGDDWQGGGLRAESLADGGIRLTGKFGMHQPGNRLVLSHEPRVYTALSLIRCQDSLIEDVVIYHALSMGITAQLSHNITLRRIRTVPRPDSSDPVSCNADSTHFSNCSGMVTVEDCVFESEMDDPLNCHGYFTTIERIFPDRKTCLVRFHHAQHAGVDIYRAGDHLEFLEAAHAVHLHDEVLTDAVAFSELQILLYFSEPLPPAIGIGTAVDNRSRQCGLTVRRCRMGLNRARGLLISTAGPVLIEENTFYNGGAAIFMDGADTRYWYESGRCENVIIRNNLFSGCARGPWHDALICITSYIRPENGFSECFHRKIMIEGNRIETFEKAVLTAGMVDGITIRDNTIVNDHTFPPYRETEAIFNLYACRNAVVTGNRIEGFDGEKVLAETH